MGWGLGSKFCPHFRQVVRAGAPEHFPWVLQSGTKRDLNGNVQMNIRTNNSEQLEGTTHEMWVSRQEGPESSPELCREHCHGISLPCCLCSWVFKESRASVTQLEERTSLRRLSFTDNFLGCSLTITRCIRWSSGTSAAPATAPTTSVSMPESTSLSTDCKSLPESGSSSGPPRSGSSTRLGWSWSTSSSSSLS